MTRRASRGRGERLPPRERRGSVTVMAGVFIVAFALFGAGVVDATRLFTVRTEMQTVADAAALAGAIQMLRDSSVAADSAIGYAQRNGARTSGTNPDSVGVTAGVWSPAINAFVAGGDPSDAIRVGVARTVPFILAQLIGGTGVRMSVTATAWSSAPVVGSRGCIKPLVLPYDYLRRLVDAPSSTMTLDDLRRLRELTPEERTDTIEFGTGLDSPTDERYYVATLPPINRETGERLEEAQGDFREYLVGCKSTKVSAGDWLALEPRGTWRQELLSGLEEYCENAADDGGLGGEFAGGSCFVGGVVVPMPMKVAFWETAPEFLYTSYGQVQVKALGSFGVTNIDPTQIQNPEYPDEDYQVPRASLTGHLTMDRDFGQVGNEPSTLRRVVIVE